MQAQLNLLEEIIVDNFAGGGGASTGIELAAGRPVDIAINHDPDAILMHKTNHPYTTHYQESVWDIDPVEVCAGRPVGLAWFSPDCKHFSKAKGGKPVNKTIRGLAWIVLRWAGTVRPRVVILENVEEFQTWGPVRRGKPIKSKAGQTFGKFITQLRALGYRVEWRELVAADYGAPTTRKRFFLIARCDGEPIAWPVPTHAPANSPAVMTGEKKPWRAAAEIIDWSLPCPSIFDSKDEIKQKYGLTAQRPLRPNTMRRVARGIEKFVLNAPSPFLVIVNHSGDFRGQEIGEPLQTITAKHGYGIVQPKFSPCVPWTVTNTTNSTGHSVREPVDTARTGGGGGQMFISANLIQYHTEKSELVRGQELHSPIMTIDTAPRYGLIVGALTKYYGGVIGTEATNPLPTITAIDHNALTVAALTKYYGSDKHGQNVREPLHTVTTKDREGVLLANVCKMKGENIGSSAATPVQTITASGCHHAIVTTTVATAQAGNLGRWVDVRRLLNEHCGYHLADDEVLMLHIGDGWYFITDIGLRMLTPRELYSANGFPLDYIIERDYTGRAYGKTKQVARCGNAVPPQLATALVRANLPEWCGQEIGTMEQLEQLVAI